MIWKGGKRNLPQVTNNWDFTKSEFLDKDLQKLFKIRATRDAQNAEASFWSDNIASTFAYMVVYTFMGRGFVVNCEKNKKDQEIIRNFNKKINVRGETIEDYIISTWFDNLIHAKGVWRIAKNIENFDGTYQAIDIQRVPPETLREVTDNFYGWLKFIQYRTAYETYNTPSQFLKEDLKSSGTLKTEVVIPDDPRVCLHLSFFKRPPVHMIIDYIIFKIWIIAFMRKFAEKMWAPYMIGKVGDKNSYPNSEPEMSAALEVVSAMLSQLKNFGTAAFPGNTSVDMIDPKSNGDIFIQMYNLMNQEIMLGLFSSIATRESTGVYKGNDLPDETTTRFYEGVRDKIEQTLSLFYTTNLPISSEIEDITYVWPELRSTQIAQIISSLEIATKSGVFINALEIRRAFSSIFPWLMEKEVSPEEVNRLDKERITMLAPSQPGETTTSAAGINSRRNKGTAKKSN